MTQDDKSSRLQREIDANLRRVYDDVAREEIPDRFTQLLARLKQAEEKQTGGDAQ